MKPPRVVPEDSKADQSSSSGSWCRDTTTAPPARSASAHQSPMPLDAVLSSVGPVPSLRHVDGVARGRGRRCGARAREVEAPGAVERGGDRGLQIASAVRFHGLDGAVRAVARLAELQLDRLSGVPVVLAVFPVRPGQLAVTVIVRPLVTGSGEALTVSLE